MRGEITMSNYRAGDIIRLTRIASGMSQETLSEGICSVQTLHRIENGKTRVKKELYQLLMTKMERIPQKNYAVCVGKDMELLEERMLFEKAMNSFDFNQAEKYLMIMKEKADDNKITRQYLLKAEALVKHYKHDINEEQLIEKLEQSIAITLPDYKRCLEQKYPFTEQEIMNLMSMANAYFGMDKYDKAIGMYDKLLECLNMDYIVGKQVEHMQMIIMKNKAMLYVNIKQYEKALLLQKEASEIARRNNDGKALSVIIADMSWCILRQIQNGERSVKDMNIAEKYLRQGYYIAAARGDDIMKQSFKNGYKKDFKRNN